MGTAEQKVLLASDAGYGFITELSNMVTKNTKGKAMLTVAKECEALPPAYVNNYENDYLGAITSEGRMLIIPAAVLPELPRGKGNKIIQIPPARVKTRDEFVTLVGVFSEGATIKIHAGKRYLRLTPSNIIDFVGERGRRGRKLPRGFRNADRIEVLHPGTNQEE
jgi:topoisomerase-4 subunit A